MARRIVFFIILTILVSGAALAQNGGQLWVRAYEDRNGNGTRESDEPTLTRSISVNLLNAEGVVVASSLLEDSVNVGQGLVGFQMLPPGDYTVVVTSADYQPTAGDTFTVTITGSGVPPVLQYGAQPLVVQVEAAASNAGNDQIMQIAVSAAGAVAVMCAMAVLGFLIYMLTLRRKLLEARAADARLTTGSMRSVRVSDTGSFRPATGEFRKGTDEIRTTGTSEQNKP